ncbi:hypothetical protein RJ641_005476 [Dillenia turbinata]|uniref:Uncharacterized protein n=1 Tax=Dillenia turbinata TaxID=194707 RepID=A0AAN8VG19_9MAGN
MATVPSSPLQFPNRLPSTISSSRASLLTKPHAPPLHLSLATDPESTTSSQTAPDDQPNPQPEQEAFENRLSQVRLRYRSGTGKKAEIRKIRSGKKPSSSTSSVFLPPVQLKEPVSNGFKVETGFTPYTEWLNGRLAVVGLAALLTVELATGKSLINYHTPAIVLIQIYFVAAVGALFVKFEKEMVSVWPSEIKK